MGGLAQNVQKPPPGKNVQIPKVKYFRNAKVKFPRSNSQGQISQGQIFQECQGQISQGQIPKVKWENKNGKLEKTGLNRKKPEKWEMEKWESVTKIKNQKHLKRY